MAWGGPTTLHSEQSNSDQANDFNGITCAAKTLIVVVGRVRLNVASLSISVTDSGGNSYVVAQSTNTANFTPDLTVFIAYTVAASALSSGSITVDVGDLPLNQEAVIYGYTGHKFSLPEDSAAAAVKAASATTSPTITSGTPGFTGSLMISAYAGGVAPTYTTDTGHGWSSLLAVTILGLAVDSQINSGSSSKISNPTTSSSAYTMAILAFKVAAVTNQSVDPTSGSTMTMSQLATYLKTVSASAASTFSMLRAVTYNIAVTVQNGYDLLIDAVFQPGGTTTDQDVNATAPSSVSISTVTSYLRTISADAASAFTLTAVAAYLKIISVSNSATAAISTVANYLIAVAASASSVASLSVLSEFVRTISVSAPSMATLTRGLSALRTISASAASSVSVFASFTYSQTVTAAVSAVAAIEATFVAFVASFFFQDTDIDSDRKDPNDPNVE